MTCKQCNAPVIEHETGFTSCQLGLACIPCIDTWFAENTEDTPELDLFVNEFDREFTKAAFPTH